MSRKEHSRGEHSRTASGQEGTVLEIFRYQQPTPKIKKENKIPVYFKVRLKKSPQPVFMPYNLLRERFPYILIDFFQKKAVLNDGSHDYAPLAEISRQNDDREEIKEQKMIVKEISKQNKMQTEKQINKITKQTLLSQRRPQRIIKPPKNSKYMQEEPNHIEERYERQIQSNQHIPISNPTSAASTVPTVSPLPIPTTASTVSTKQNQNKDQKGKEKTGKKILDYDYMVEELCCMNLISPAVICNSSRQRQVPIVTYQVPTRVSFAPANFERQPYSSQQFKESDESQFVLDERGKQKRRRDKMLREQERMMKKKKIKKSKKKKKTIR